MELKLLCGCGQKFKFDVEPLNGQMPFTVNCPVCGADGTASANATLAQSLPQTAAPSIRMAPAPPVARAVAPPPPAPGPITVPRVAAAKTKAAGEFNLGMGALGAVLGAILGVGLVYGFYLLTGFRIPFSNFAIGALTGGGARLLYKGTSSTLGVVSALIALVGVAGSLYMIYGDRLLELWVMLAIATLVSTFAAYRIASG